jgi:hypothetical protein
MKKLFLLVSVFFIALSINAQNQTPPVLNDEIGPIIKFDDPSHDFGTIEEGTRATHEFEFLNSGDKDLILQDVKASCGCTAPTWPREPIKPGGKGKINVVFNSTGFGGNNFHKSVTVTTNMKTDNVKILYIKGTVARRPAPAEAPPQSPVKIEQH